MLSIDGHKFLSLAAYERYIANRQGTKKASAAKKEADADRTVKKQKELFDWLERKAKKMRTSPTEAELRLKQLLDKENIMYHFQKPIAYRKKENNALVLKGYIIDFYLVKEQIIIEVDGGYHTDLAQQAYDKARYKRLLNVLPKHVVRLKHEEIMSDFFNIFDVLIRCKSGLVTNLNEIDNNKTLNKKPIDSKTLKRKKKRKKDKVITQVKQKSFTEQILSSGPIVRKRKY